MTDRWGSKDIATYKFRIICKVFYNNITMSFIAIKLTQQVHDTKTVTKFLSSIIPTLKMLLTSCFESLRQDNRTRPSNDYAHQNLKQKISFSIKE